MAVIRWLIKTSDRIGMVQDVVEIFSHESISISSMEVSTGKIYIKFSLNDVHEELLKQELLSQTDVLEVMPIALQPQEERERELQALLESASEGIIGLDNQATIRYVNSVAAKLLRIEAKETVGKEISEFMGSSAPFNGLLAGDSFDNKEMLVETPRGTLHYLCSGRPIRDENNRVAGAVATLKSMQAARQLVRTITKTHGFGFNDIIYTSQLMGEVVSIAKKVAKNNCTILIRGESGTGKELFARAIHDTSNRINKPFIPINCAALPDALLESELFGYEEGAFSGAIKGGKIGLFEAAHQGTLFLDEIGELPLALQGKLLRSIQEGVVRRVGGNRQIAVDVRILAATNRNLEEMVAAKQFREDLFHRINVIPIRIPSLRERPEDIPLLLRYFLNKYCAEQNKELEFSTAAINFLTKYAWAGNVRELQNVVLRAVHLTVGNTIDTANLLLSSEPPCTTSLTPEEKNLKQTINYTERIMLEEALKKCGSARRAAKELGLSHTTVLKKIRLYGLEHLYQSN